MKNASTIEMVLYPDCDRHKEYIDELILNADNHCDYVAIKHDKDFNNDGTPKKTHYHFVFCLENATTIGGMNKRFPNVESNLFEYKNNRKQSLLYLTHQSANARQEGKTLYDRNELFGNPKYIARAYTEDHQHGLETILQWIELTPRVDVTFTNLMRFCLENSLHNTFRKYSYIIKEIMAERVGKRLTIQKGVFSND